MPRSVSADTPTSCVPATGRRSRRPTRAQSGLVGQSAQAISAKTQRWQATTAALERVLASQATALASASNAYAETEADNHRAIAALDPTSL